MHRICLFLTYSIFLIFLAVECRAQELGFYGTLNNTNLKGDKPQRFQFSPDYGYDVGIILGLRVSETMTLAFHPGFAQSNSKVQIRNIAAGPAFLDSLNVQVNYLVLPVRMNNSIGKLKKLYFVSGFSIVIVLKERVTLTKNATPFSIPDEPEALNAQKVNYFIDFGLGYRIPIKPGFLFLEMNYSQGINNITDFNNPNELFSRVKLQGIRWSIGMVFNLKKSEDEE